MPKQKSRTTTELNAAIDALRPDELAALRVLAVCYAPLYRSTLAQCLQKLGVHNEATGRIMGPNNVAPLLDKLKSNGLVVEKIIGGYCCNRRLGHKLMAQAPADGWLKEYAMVVQGLICPTRRWDGPAYRSFDLCVQDIRIALYRGSADEVTQLLEQCRESFPDDFARNHPVSLICPDPVDVEWLSSMPGSMLELVLFVLLSDSILELKPSEELFTLLENRIQTGVNVSEDCRVLYLVQLLLRGRLRDAGTLLADGNASWQVAFRGWLAALHGDDDRAVELFGEGLALFRKEAGKRNVFLPGLPGVFHLFTLVRTGLPQHLKSAANLAKSIIRQRADAHKTIIRILYLFAEVMQGNSSYRNDFDWACAGDQHLGPVSQLVHSAVAVQSAPTAKALHFGILTNIRNRAEAAGYLWIAAEAAAMMKVIDPKREHHTAVTKAVFEREGLAGLAGTVGGGDEWERSIKALLALGASAGKTLADATAAAKPTRMIWLLDGEGDHVSIQPIEQKQTGGGWSPGRAVALKRLMEDAAKPDLLAAQDRRIASCIRKMRSGYGYYTREIHAFDIIRAVRAMIGHPLAFSAKHPGEPVGVARGEFTLKVARKEGGLFISFVPQPADDSAAFMQWDGSSRLLLFEPTAEQRRISSIIGKGLAVPASGEAQVMAAITAVSPHVVIHSDVAGENAAAERVEADGRLHVILRPSGAGLAMETLVRPLGDGGPSFHPGRGGLAVIADVGGKKLQTERDHEAERRHLAMLTDACNALEPSAVRDGAWRVEDPESCLELLEDIQRAVSASSGAMVIHWPEGERLKLRGSASWQAMKLSVRSGKDWFSLEGEVAVSETEVLTLQRLMELAETTPGRFMQLGEGEFVALTDEFRRKLDDLRRVLARHGKDQRFHPLVAPLVEDAASGAASLKGDKAWMLNVEKLRSAEAFQPALPPTLQAGLRDYQRDGFDWLSRLAQWGAGACLADDMGLGKTVQALALLLTRAADGPALVLAPTSVCLNWESETIRFAPTLNPRIFGQGDRAKFVADLKPFDLVICSYTLFQQEAELLTSVEWETVVLDEAQAIKNTATKRSQAAMQINAGFRIATTGTPVENRLDELWNLFNFLNPGLLGSQKAFSERFAMPIEKRGDKAARNTLKRLIRPFILRRVKSQVLEELPPRTDIVQRVELSGEEMTFYEALRRKAIENLEGSEGQPPGERQIRILAEIMRLRRACCNPALVMPDCGIPGSKLAAFREIVDELRDNGHRALVFSQFVGHLSILRAELDGAKIAYQYLDGSTPPKERQQSVADFQAGKGDLFLISLKAGGVGLNLTAADYVIHMDPWWNPAVEDQASDRAHRIGQLRPVTVYRLVAANTIEEKIVALHSKKRDLADSLLEGTETAGRVSADELMGLLRGEAFV
ncbi:MAG: DEAD/DEAH box helicase [Nitrospirae bacterium]|nr:DEAD/DEAH box helicase [Nitrospirota bacterium]